MKNNNTHARIERNCLRFFPQPTRLTLYCFISRSKYDSLLFQFTSGIFLICFLWDFSYPLCTFTFTSRLHGSMLCTWRKSSTPHPNRPKTKLQTKNRTSTTNRHVATYSNPHPKRTNANNHKNFDLRLYRGRGVAGKATESPLRVQETNS